MLGANVEDIPTPPPQSQPIVGVDGFWGSHEWTIYPQLYHHHFPYLAWIALPSPSHSTAGVASRPIEKTMWRPHPDRSDVHVINPVLLDELKAKWEVTKAALKVSFSAMSSIASLSSIEQPKKAYLRAVEALQRLEMEFRAWRDFVEVFRNLQRALLELGALLDWWSDVRVGDAFEPSIRPPTRGVIFQDESLYINHARWSLAAYLLIPKPKFALDLSKKVVLSPRKSCKAQPMSELPLVHSLPHWYYPPVMQDVVTDLETTAQGYAERLDNFQPTKTLKRKLDKSERKVKDESKYILHSSLIQANDLCIASCRVKQARTNMLTQVNQLTNLELRRLNDAGAAPAWFPKIQEVWIAAMNHVSHHSLASTSSTHRFVLPPIHLFWGGNENTQQLFYYHFLVLRHETKHRHIYDVLALTTKEWRSILSNTHWKLQWLKRDSPSPDTPFDPSVFWKYSSPLFFGKERSDDVAAGCQNPKSPLPCGCDVQMTTADDPDVRQVVLYYLNLFHVIEEIKELERIQFLSKFEQQWKYQGPLVELMAEMWDPCRGSHNYNFFRNKKAWRNWFRLMHKVVMHWDGFDDWDWGHFSGVRSLGIDALSEQDFRKLTVQLLMFFIHSFVSRLGYYPSPILHPPILATVSCAIHRRKFGHGFLNFIM